MIVLLGLLAPGWTPLAWAEEPYAGYALELIRAEFPTAGDAWEDVGSGGYLFRFFFDVDDDGIDELFLTSSLATFRGRSEWRAFRWEAERTFVAYPEPLIFGLRSFIYQQTAARTTIVDYFSKRHEGEWDKFSFLRYDFQNGTLTRRTGIVGQEEIDLLDEATKAGTLLDFTANLEAISLRELVEDERPAWRKVDPEQWDESNEANFRPKLRGTSLSSEEFTAQRAYDLMLAGGLKNFLLAGGGSLSFAPPMVARPTVASRGLEIAKKEPRAASSELPAAWVAGLFGFAGAVVVARCCQRQKFR